jgi:Armadillo/beta-catenin-like repeat
MKILTRKEVNRKSLTPDDIRAVAVHLKTPFNQEVAAEAANVLLNACHEKQHVIWAVETNLVPYLIRLLYDGSMEVQANVAGALQSISFQVCLRLIQSSGCDAHHFRQ